MRFFSYCLCGKRYDAIAPEEILPEEEISHSVYSHAHAKPPSEESDNSKESVISIMSASLAAAINNSILSVSSKSSAASNVIIMPEFYMKFASIGVRDYLAAQRSWEMIMNNELYIFHNLKQQNATDSIDCLNWVYDTYFSLINSEDMQTSEPEEVIIELDLLFRNNIKVQSRAFTQIIKYSIFMAKCEAKCVNGLTAASTTPVNFENMYKAHAKMGISFQTYLFICKCLIKTIERCFEYDWNADIIIAWKRIISYSIDRVAPYYKNYITRIIKDLLNSGKDNISNSVHKVLSKDKTTVKIN